MTVPSLPEDGERSATPTGATPRESRDSLEPAVKTKRVDVGGILVEVLADNRDSGWYLQRKTFEEKASLLYRFIREEGFATFVDVGANYGFVSMLVRRNAPGLDIIAIEADPLLANLIEANFLNTKLLSPVVINAIAGDHSQADARFSLNPASQLHKRVTIANWEQIKVDRTSTRLNSSH